MTTKTTVKIKEKETAKVVNKVNDRYESIKDNVSDIRDLSFRVTEDSIEGILDTAGRLQSLSEKAAKGGMKLFDKQMDMFVSSLKTVKEKITTERKRIKEVFSEN